MPANASLSETKVAADVIHQGLLAMNGVVESQRFIGEGAPRVSSNMMQSNDGVESFANGFVTTRDVDDPRKILPALQKRLMKALPEARVMVMPFEQGPSFSAPIELRITGPNLDVLKGLGEQLRFILSGIDAVSYSTATVAGSSAQLSVYPKDNQLAMLGMRNHDLPMQLNGELTGIEAGSVMEGSTQIPISVRCTDNVRSRLDTISSSPLTAGNSSFVGYGGIIVLSALKANTPSRHGDVDAIVLVVMNATRHIVSTTVTTIGGFLPLILFGGHFWPPLAIAGGVAGSAILALYLVPAMFSHVARKDQARAKTIVWQHQSPDQLDDSTAAVV